LPVHEQFGSVELRPCQDQSFLPARKVTCDPLDWIHCIDADMLLIVGMKMR
jgi:hypothetical protein